MSKISVIVPVYNVEKYLNSCIDSLINQTYKNIEIILVNDGSTDNSAKLCDDFAKKIIALRLYINKTVDFQVHETQGFLLQPAII